MFIFLRLVHSTPNRSTSPLDSLDIFLPSSTPNQNNSNELNPFLPSPAQTKTSSTLFPCKEFSNTSTDPKMTGSAQMLPSQTRSSTRLRQLLSNRSPSTNENPSQTLHYHADDFLQQPESPSSTRLSPLLNDLPSPMKRQRKTTPSSNEQLNSSDILLKKILGKQNSASTSPNRADSIHSDDSSSNGQTTNKQRSDTYLRVIINDNIIVT